jgi:hypothetical protein
MMTNIRTLIVGSSLLVPLVGGPAEYPVHRESSTARTLRFAGAGVHTLDVRVTSGAIRVVGDEGADVRVEATTKISAETDEAARAAERGMAIEFSDGAVTVAAVVRDEDGSTCGARGSDRRPAWWDRRRYEVTVDFTIRVPRETRVRLCTVNGAGVRVEGTSGDFDVESVNGGVTLDRLRGSGRGTTVNGAVVATFAETPRSASLLKTVNGDIEVTLPADASADLRLKTFNGGLFTDFDVEPQAAKAEAAPRSQSGRFVYRSRSFTTVRVGRGGPEMTLDTFNGSVRVLRAR